MADLGDLEELGGGAGLEIRSLSFSWPPLFLWPAPMGLADQTLWRARDHGVKWRGEGGEA